MQARMSTIECIVYEVYEERGECMFFGSEELANELAPVVFPLGSLPPTKAIVNLSKNNIENILMHGYTSAV